MLEYEALGEGQCRMAYLTASLDDPASAACGRCDTCAGPWYPAEVNDDDAEAAQTALNRVGAPIDPRSQWPVGMPRLGIDLKGHIPAGERHEPGRVVARLTDLGYGTALRELFAVGSDGRPLDAPVSAPLAAACLRTLREWDWEQRPAAVAWVPSLSRPTLVSSLAAGIAQAGRLTLLGPLDLAPGAAPLNRSTNAAYRLRDVLHRFQVPEAMAARLPELAGPVLLIDDLVESRWTLTIAARLLRQAGAGMVLPFALAAAG